MLKNLKQKIRCIHRYCKNYGISFFSAIFKVKFVQNDLSKILHTAKIINIAEGDFFYSIDDSVSVQNINTIINNFPVDYKLLLEKNFIANTDTEIVIRRYIERINDPRVSLNKAVTLKDALQKILFWNSLLWQTGHKLVGLGRLDKVLNEYSVPKNAEDLICDFLKTLNKKYKFKSASLYGDTGQVILLGGLEENGEYFRNQYTDLFIKCLKKINLPDPKIVLRCSKNMPLDLVELAIDCVSTGIGSPLFSNDDVIIKHLEEFRYEKCDSHNYGVSTCWEPLSIGNSLEQNNLQNINFGKCANEFLSDVSLLSCKTFNDVYDLFFQKLKATCDEIRNFLDEIEWEKDPLLSFMLSLDKDISEGGTKYKNYGILSVGLASAVNSLLNIKHNVFEKNLLSLSDVQKIILSNYSECNEIDIILSNLYGTESPEAIELTNKIIKDTELCFVDYKNKFDGKVKFGLSSPAYIDGSKSIGATFDGRKFGEPFATHISKDNNSSITEIMNFVSKLKFSSISCNANVIDIMIQSTLIKDNIKKLSMYLLGGIKSGIFQLQMNVLSYKQLVDAKVHPEKYPNLIVRVWGFSSYFNDLPEITLNFQKSKIL